VNPTDYFDADELEIIDRAILTARQQADFNGVSGLGIIPIIMAVVSFAAQMATATIAKTKAAKAQAAALKLQAEQMRAYAAEQKQWPRKPQTSRVLLSRVSRLPVRGRVAGRWLPWPLPLVLLLSI
jgi:hypothetical protein